MANDNEDEIFSDNPDEQLNIENEILKLKLQAELGGSFESEGILPPDIENAFLKNVIEFEHKYAKSKQKTLFEILDKPNFPAASSLSDEQIKNELEKLERLMQQKGVIVDYADEYTPRLKYTFLTEELFQKEAGVVDMPGLTMHYIYEEFHPNHSLDIKNIAADFFNSWVNRAFNEFSSELATSLNTPDNKPITKEEILHRFQNIFAAYIKFEHASYTVDDISFTIKNEQEGDGYAKGHIAYDAVLENGDTKHIEGEYALYMHYDGYWSVVTFDWPGFVW